MTYYNPNPKGKTVGDCVIRALSKILRMDWDSTYAAVVAQGYAMKDMPSSNSVWGQYLIEHGFRKHIVPDQCPDCYTVQDFCRDHPQGDYIVVVNNHVVAVSSGDFYDTWDSGHETVDYFFERG